MIGSVAIDAISGITKQPPPNACSHRLTSDFISRDNAFYEPRTGEGLI